MHLLEQLFRFHDFRKITLHIEFGQHGSKHFGYPACSAISLVQACKSKGAAQLESLRLLVSCDLKRSVEGSFGTGFVRRIKTRQKLAADAMQLGIKPMLAGLPGPCDQFAQDF